MRRALFIWSISVAVALVSASAASAEVIYTHGTINPPNSGPWTAPGTLWAMPDGGGTPHPLLAASQLPGDQAAVCCSSLQANSATLAFDSATYENTGTTLGNGLNYEGAYALAGGKATRLSPAPEASPGNESSDAPVALTADGRVVFLHDNCQNVENMNVLPTCEDSLNVIPDTGGTASTWTYFGLNNEPPAAFAGDPANAGMLAYVNVVYDTSTSEDEDFLLIANQTASNSTDAVVATQSAGENPAWSPDGLELVDDTPPPVPASGDPNPAALWLFPASANQSGKELLSDPTSPSTRFANPVFAGPNEIVFAADDNLYEIPASCNSCVFPGAAQQLTHDGTAAAPDSDPSWTQQTVIPLATNPPPPKLSLTLTASSSQKVVKQKGIVATFECTITCAIAAAGQVKINGSKKTLATASAGGTLAANRRDKITLKLSKSELKAISKALAKHKRVTATVAATAQDSAKRKAAATKSFTVKH